MAYQLDQLAAVARPQYPDFYKCNAYYGNDISAIDCIDALMLLPVGSGPVPYTHTVPLQGWDRGPYVLPWRGQSGQYAHSLPHSFTRE